ncbi:MAG: class I tRNA ligase family protein, partial [Nitriliruptoraceae bacterium]
LPGDTEVVERLDVADLVGLHYRPPFDFVEIIGDGDRHHVTTADFVTASDGSGIVHLAPAFGADDMAVGRREGLPTANPVDAQGQFTSGPWQGQFVKDTDPAIIEDLRDRGLLITHQTYTHTYPFCWRCDRPLIYWAKPSWYIRTTAVRDQLLENNAGIDWHPEHIRDGRFGNWLENNVDWALSRDRYWGTPLPFWVCDGCGDVAVAASRADLSELSGQDLHELDPHRPYVDAITWPCDHCSSGTRHRVPDVADAWFDSGGMPYAQWGYPHTGREEFERHYPADYICEAIDQTRGWFYTLLAESTLLFGDSSYRTCLCLGHIVDEGGRKMSKSTGNVLDPWELIGTHGADALRWLMFAEGNPWVSRRVGHQLLEDVTRRFLLTLWNTHVFFLTYASIDGFDLDAPAPAVVDRPAADRWVLAELADLVATVDQALDTYDVSTATRRLERFVEDLSNWYVRRNRRRFWKSLEEGPEDKAAAYHTLHTCLSTLSRLLAPFIPFLSDRLWHDLEVSVRPDAAESVHLTDFPVVDPAWQDDELRAAMRTARRVVELGRQARNDSGLRVRQPLGRALVSVPDQERSGLHLLLDDVADELNIHTIELSGDTDDLVERHLRPNFRALGPAFQQRAPRVAAAIGDVPTDQAADIARRLEHGPVDLDVEGEVVSVDASMVEVVTAPLTGWAVASDGTSTFALDTTLTRALEVEGAGREIVRAVNDARREAGLRLDDRICLTLATRPTSLHTELDDAGLLAEIAREVLADEVVMGDAEDVTQVALGDLGTVRFEITT